LLIVAALRPHLLVPAWLAALTGAAAVDPDGTVSATSSLAVERIVAAWLGWSLILAAINGANLVTDRATDRLNAKNLFWMETLPATALIRVSLLTALLGLALAGWGLPGSLVPAGLTLILGLLYSLPPVRLSARAGWDAAAHVLGYVVLAPWFGQLVLIRGSGWAALPEWPTVAHLGPVVLTGFLWTAILDIHGDELTGKQTAAVRWGETGVQGAALFLLAGWLVMQQLGSPLLAPVSGGVAVATISALGLAGILTRGRVRRRWLICGVFAAAMLAGAPGLAAYRWSIPVAGSWLLCSYAVTALVQKFDT